MSEKKRFSVIELDNDNDFFVIDTEQCDEASKQSAFILSNERFYKNFYNLK